MLRIIRYIRRLMMLPFKPVMISIAKRSWLRKIRWLRSPSWVNFYIRSRFRYETDEVLFGLEERPQSALEMLRGEIGDCEDWAEAVRVLLHPDWRPVLFYASFRNPATKAWRAHIVCLYQQSDVDYAYIDTAGHETNLAYLWANVANRIRHNLYKDSFVVNMGETAWDGQRWELFKLPLDMRSN